MKLKLASFELAKKLKDVGCILENCTCGGFPECICDVTGYENTSLELAKMWFREKHNVFIQIEVDCTIEPKFCFTYLRYMYNDWFNMENPNYSDLYYTYEEALEAGLLEACKLIKNK